LRNNTEWVETLGNGNMLTAIDIESIKSSTHEMINQEFPFHEPFYGSGDAATKIGKILAARWQSD
jgi:UDP-N-acetylglucosamine 2-epimerase